MLSYQISLFMTGCVVGAFGTLIGVGGGIIFVPIFLLALHWEPQLAVGTSLAIVFLNAVSGSAAYIKQKKVYYDAAVRFSIATVPGALAGGYLASYFTHAGFHIAFGVLLMCIAVIMFFRPSPNGASFDSTGFSYNRTVGVLISIAVGFLSSVFGVGGGIIHVPAMVYLLGFPTHIATATSQFVLAVSSLFGVISHYLAKNILVTPALIIGAGAILGAQIGARISLRVKSRIILLLLSVALFVLGIRLIITAYGV
jgi:uncharacterized membrane protein YfcA